VLHHFLTNDALAENKEFFVTLASNERAHPRHFAKDLTRLWRNDNHSELYRRWREYCNLWNGALLA